MHPLTDNVYTQQGHKYQTAVPSLSISCDPKLEQNYRTTTLTHLGRKKNQEEVNFREGLQAASSSIIILRKSRTHFFMNLLWKQHRCQSITQFSVIHHQLSAEMHMHFSEMASAKAYLSKTPFPLCKRRHQINKSKKKKIFLPHTMFSGRILTQFLYLRGTDILKKYLLIFYVNYPMTETVTFSRSGCSLCKW